jgi:hypothetical protein
MLIGTCGKHNRGNEDELAGKFHSIFDARRPVLHEPARPFKSNC